METHATTRRESATILKIAPTKNKIFIRTSDIVYVLDRNEIIYLKASGNYTEIHTSTGKSILSSKTLKHYERTIGSSHFLRTHQSYVVNLNYISEFHLGSKKEIRLKNNHRIPVSRARYSTLFSRLDN